MQYNIFYVPLFIPTWELCISSESHNQPISWQKDGQPNSILCPRMHLGPVLLPLMWIWWKYKVTRWSSDHSEKHHQKDVWVIAFSCYIFSNEDTLFLIKWDLGGIVCFTGIFFFQKINYLEFIIKNTMKQRWPFTFYGTNTGYPRWRLLNDIF